MVNITPDELKFWFNQKGNRYQNATGMQMRMHEKGNQIWTEFDLMAYGEDPIALSIYTEYDLPEEFIELFRIKNIDDIEKLGYNNSWIRYLNGLATITVKTEELEAELQFRIHNDRTTVSSLELHFYDEVNEHLTMVDDFMNYLLKRGNFLETAVQNRYKWRNRRWDDYLY